MSKKILDPDNVLTDAEYAVLVNAKAGGRKSGAIRRALHARNLGWCPDCARAGQPAVYEQAQMHTVDKRQGYSAGCLACNRARDVANRRQYTARHSSMSDAEIRGALAGRLFACFKCGSVHGPEGFSIHRKEPHGLNRACLACTRAQSSAHQKSRPDLHRARGARRRATKLCANVGWDDTDPVVTLERTRWFTAAFMGVPEADLEIAHVVPLKATAVLNGHRRRVASGLHVSTNLMFQPKAVNASLGSDLPRGLAWLSQPPTFEQVSVVVHRDESHRWPV